MHSDVIPSLSEPMSDIKYSAYNKKRFDPSYAKRIPDPKPTTEFRQHEGTLDPDQAMLWAKFCIELVNWCRNAPDRPFRRLCEKELDDQALDSKNYMKLDAICRVIELQLGEKK